MAYNIAYSISESITANESIMFDSGSNKLDEQSYAIIRCVTRDIQLMAMRKGTAKV